MFSTVISDLMVLMVFLLLGFVLREVIKPLQKAFIPAGIIGGIIALIVGPQVLGWIEIPETWSGMATPMINVVLTCMIFGTVFNKGKVKTYIGSITIVSLTYFAQLFVGTLAGMGLSQIWPDLPYGWGVMGIFTFWGGHGAGSSAGSIFEDLGVENMLSMGIVLATIGLIVAMVVGMALVNYGIRKKYANNLTADSDGKIKVDGGALPPEKRLSLGKATVSSSGINGLALQFCFIMFSMFIGEKLFALIALVIPQASSIPALLYGIIGAAILWTVMRKTKLDKFVDKPAVNTISGLALEICIIAATATMNLKMFATYFAPIVIYSIILIVLMIFLCMVVVRRWIKKDWFELALLFFGQGTGSAPSGIALARCIDPDTKSENWDAFGVSSGVFTPISSTLVAIIPLLAMQSLWVVTGIGAAATLVLVLFGELVLRKTKTQ